MLLYGDESEAPTQPYLTQPYLTQPYLTQPYLARAWAKSGLGEVRPGRSPAWAKSGADMRVLGTRSSQKSGNHGIT